MKRGPAAAPETASTAELTRRQLAAVKLIADGWNVANAASQLGLKVRFVQKLLSEAGRRVALPQEQHLLLGLARWYWIRRGALRPLRRPARAPTVRP